MSRIVDNKGIWVTNVGAYPMQDPYSGVRIDPGESVQVKETTWVATQLELGCLDLVVTEEATVAAEVPANKAAKK